MPDYSALQKTAASLITKNGGAFSVRRQVGGTYDPVEGIMSGGCVEAQSANAVVLPPKTSGYPQKYEGVQNILTNAIDVLFSTDALAWAIEPGHEIQFNGEWWAIRSVSALSPDGATTLIYKAWAVRA